MLIAVLTQEARGNCGSGAFYVENIKEELDSERGDTAKVIVWLPINYLYAVQPIFHVSIAVLFKQLSESVQATFLVRMVP